MTWTLTTSGSTIIKAGLNANSTIVGYTGVYKTALDKWSDHSEGFIQAKTRRDWVGDYTGLSTEIKSILSDVSSSYVAIQIIAYDMSGYPRSAEAQTLLDIHDNIVQTGITILKDFKSNDIMSVD